MRPSTPLALLVALAACSAPNVTEELTAARAFLAQTDARFRPVLEPIAAAERSRAELALVAAGENVDDLVGCDGSDAFGLSPDCRLVTNAVIMTDLTTATDVMALLTALDGYLAALSAIATSEDSQALAQAVSALSSSLGEAQEDNFSGLTELREFFRERGDGLSRATGFLVKQRRIAALRRTVRQADPILAEALKKAAEFTNGDDRVENARVQLDDANFAVELAQDSGDPTAARQATNEQRAAYRAFTEVQQQSPAYAFYLLRRMHGDLLSLVNGSGRPEDILRTLQEMEVIIIEFKG